LPCRKNPPGLLRVFIGKTTRPPNPAGGCRKIPALTRRRGMIVPSREVAVLVLQASQAVQLSLVRHTNPPPPQSRRHFTASACRRGSRGWGVTYCTPSGCYCFVHRPLSYIKGIIVAWLIRSCFVLFEKGILSINE